MLLQLLEPYMTVLTEAEATRKLTQILAEPSSVQAYARLEGTLDGRLLNVDIARFLLPEYNTKEGAQKYTRATHEPASSWIKAQFNQRLLEAPKGPVMMLAGGGGSGKSTVAQGILADVVRAAEVIVDGVMSDFGRTSRRIDDVIASGRRVIYAYIYVPYAIAAERVARRFERTGRDIPETVLVEDHIGAQQTFFHLLKRYRTIDMVDLAIYDNSSSKPKRMPIAELKAKRYAQDGESLQKTAARLLPAR
jgi:predicted ABC-type ATPase